MYTMTREELLEVIGDGKFCTVHFTKRSNGEKRSMNCRLAVKKYLKGGQKSFDDGDKNLVTVFDVVKKGYRSIPCENIYKVSAKTKTWTMWEGWK